MTDTAHLALPLLSAAQAQKHVTHNEALALLDALTQLSVADRTRSAPPTTPSDGDRHIVAASPTGVWAGRAQAIAWFDVNLWRFLAPEIGWIAWVAAESLALVWTGTTWAPLVAVNPAPFLGANATADAVNRLAVSSPASLFNHAGAGHQLKINKATATDTASVLLQTGFAGRVEIGTAGDDDLTVKLQGDDSIWRNGLVIDRAGGSVAMPRTPFGANLLINGDFSVNQRSFSGGALAAGAYGVDRWKADASGASLTISGDVVTLSTGAVIQIVEACLGPWGHVCFSVEDLAGGALAVTIAGVTQTLTPASDRGGVAFDLTGVASSSNVEVKLAPAAGAVGFKRAKLESGASFSAWLPRSRAQELALCQRYFQLHRGGLSMVAPMAGQANGYGALPIAMRATPTPLMIGGAQLTWPAIGAATVTTANLASLAMRDAGVFAIAFGSGSPATAAGQAGFLHDANLFFSAEF